MTRETANAEAVMLNSSKRRDYNTMREKVFTSEFRMRRGGDAVLSCPGSLAILSRGTV